MSFGHHDDVANDDLDLKFVSKANMSVDLAREEIAKYFHLPIADAAKKIGICATVLKKICRKHNIPRWPHRKIKSIENMIASLENTPCSSPQEASKIQEELKVLASHKEFVMKNPEALVTNIGPPDQDGNPTMLGKKRKYPLNQKVLKTPLRKASKTEEDSSPQQQQPLHSHHHHHHHHSKMIHHAGIHLSPLPPSQGIDDGCSSSRSTSFVNMDGESEVSVATSTESLSPYELKPLAFPQSAVWPSESSDQTASSASGSFGPQYFPYNHHHHHQQHYQHFHMQYYPYNSPQNVQVHTEVSMPPPTIPPAHYDPRHLHPYHYQVYHQQQQQSQHQHRHVRHANSLGSSSNAILPQPSAASHAQSHISKDYLPNQQSSELPNMLPQQQESATRETSTQPPSDPRRLYSSYPPLHHLQQPLNSHQYHHLPTANTCPSGAMHNVDRTSSEDFSSASTGPPLLHHHLHPHVHQNNQYCPQFYGSGHPHTERDDGSQSVSCSSTTLVNSVPPSTTATPPSMTNVQPHTSFPSYMELRQAFNTHETAAPYTSSSSPPIPPHYLQNRTVTYTSPSIVNSKSSNDFHDIIGSGSTSAASSVASSSSTTSSNISVHIANLQNDSGDILSSSNIPAAPLQFPVSASSPCTSTHPSAVHSRDNNTINNNTSNCNNLSTDSNSVIVIAPSALRGAISTTRTPQNSNPSEEEPIEYGS